MPIVNQSQDTGLWRLEPGRVQTLSGAATDRSIELGAGRLWITFTRSGRAAALPAGEDRPDLAPALSDHWLSPGERLRIPAGCTLVMEADRGAVFTVREWPPAPAGAGSAGQPGVARFLGVLRRFAPVATASPV